MKQPKWSKMTVNAQNTIIGLTKEGKKTSEISSIMGIPYITVRNFQRKCGIVEIKRRKKLPTEVPQNDMTKQTIVEHNENDNDLLYNLREIIKRQSIELLMLKEKNKRGK